MPYIVLTARQYIDGWVRSPNSAGELNYLFTSAALEYLESRGLNYQTINDIVGALEGAKAEFQRKVVGPYEDKKIIENGDVYAKEEVS